MSTKGEYAIGDSIRQSARGATLSYPKSARCIRIRTPGSQTETPRRLRPPRFAPTRRAALSSHFGKFV
jgi:hypothetical protein